MNPLTSLIYAITRAIFDAYFDAQRASLKADVEKHDPSNDVLGDRFRTAVERVLDEPGTSRSGTGSKKAVSPIPASPSTGMGKDQ